MFKTDERLNTYYRITDPAARRAEFDRVSQEVDGEYIKCAKKYFENRHPGKNGCDTAVDIFLYNCVVLVSLSKGNILFKKAHRKEVLDFLKRSGLFDAESETEKCALYWEYRNAARRYFETCKASSYKRRFFGIVNTSAEVKEDFMRKDAYKMSEGVAQRLGLEKEMQLWTEAVKDELESLGGIDGGIVSGIT